MLLLPSHLESHNLILRPFTINDAHTLFAYAHNPLVTQFTHWSTHRSITDTLHFLKNHTTPLWAIVHKQHDLIIGECGFIPRGAHEAELHCALAPAWWGSGLAREAIDLLVSYSFAELTFTHFHALIVTENRRCIRLAQKLGMEHSTTLSQFWYANNRLYDVNVYSLRKT